MNFEKKSETNGQAQEVMGTNNEMIDVEIETETKKLESSAIEIQSEVESLGGEEGIMKSLNGMDESKKEKILNKIDNCLENVLSNKTLQTIFKFSYSAGAAGMVATLIARVAHMDGDAVNFLVHSSFPALVVPLAIKTISQAYLILRLSHSKEKGTADENNLQEA